MVSKKTEAEKVPVSQKLKKPAVDLYTIEELAAASDEVFKVKGFAARAALKAGGKAEYSINEAADVIKKFNFMEVK